MDKEPESTRREKPVSSYHLAGYLNPGFAAGGTELPLTARHPGVEGFATCTQWYEINQHLETWAGRLCEDVLVHHHPSGSYYFLRLHGRWVLPADRKWHYPEDELRRLNRKYSPATRRGGL